MYSPTAAIANYRATQTNKQNTKTTQKSEEKKDIKNLIDNIKSKFKVQK